MAYNLAAGDETDVGAGWQATLSAARHHLRWLRVELATGDFANAVWAGADGPLAVLARSLGAGADLLASQNRSTSDAFEERWLAAARSEVASITVLAARGAVTRLASRRAEDPEMGRRLLAHLVEVIEELEFHRVADPRDLGPLLGLTTTLPRTPVDDASHVCLLAARWQSTHDAALPGGVLARDLRSTTAQLRTVIGYCVYLTDPSSRVDASTGPVGELLQALRTAGSITQRVTYALRTRLSDMGGRSDATTETAFVELLQVLRRWSSGGSRLKTVDALPPDSRTVADTRDVVDELMHAAARVAEIQQKTVEWLILRGRLFVPKPVLGRNDREFHNRPGVWRLKYPQPWWVRTNLTSCFDQLVEDLAELQTQLTAAARAARIIAGTSSLRRPYGPQHFSGPPIVDKSRWRRTPPTYSDLIPDANKDLAGPER